MVMGMLTAGWNHIQLTSKLLDLLLSCAFDFIARPINAIVSDPWWLGADLKTYSGFRHALQGQVHVPTCSQLPSDVAMHLFGQNLTIYLSLHSLVWPLASNGANELCNPGLPWWLVSDQPAKQLILLPNPKTTRVVTTNSCDLVPFAICSYISRPSICSSAQITTTVLEEL